MKSKLTKLFTLLTILTLGITNVWGANTPAGAGTYVLDGKKPGGENKFYKLGDGVYVHRRNNSSWSDGSGMKTTSSNTNGIAVYVSSSMKMSGLIKKSSSKNLQTVQFNVYTLSNGSTTFDSFEAGTDNNTTVSVTLSATPTYTSSVTFDALSSNATEEKSSPDVTLAAGYYYIVPVETTSVGKTFLYSITLAAAAPETSVCPGTLTISSKDSKTAFLEGDAIELTAALTAGNGTITYQWYKGGTAESNKLTGKTAAKLEIASCVEGDAGDYYCVASKSECSDAVNADAFTITVSHNPCATHHWFVATADATANSVTNWNGFTNTVTGSNNQNNSVTIDGTTYTLTKRTGSTGGGGTILGFTIPANKAGTLYGYMKSSGSAARILSLKKGDDVIKTNTEIVDGAWTLITIDAIAPGTYTLSPDQNVQVQMFVLKICDASFNTITLEYADGETTNGSISVLDGAAATKPADPTWAHHRFDGWYNGATPYDWTANVTGDITLTAHWTQLYTVTYEAGDGTATGDAPTEADKAATETFTVAANPFTVAGKDFVKWNDGTNDYAPGATYTVGTDNVVLTAQWKAAADKYTVIFKDGTTELGTKLFDVTTNPSDADIDKTKALNTFAAWQKEGVDIALDDVFWATVAKDAEITLTARWAKAFATSVDLEGLVEASGTGADWQKYLSDHGYAFSTSNVSLDEKKDPSENKPYDNWPYQGLKAKVSGAYVEGNIEAGKLVIIKLGHMAADATVTIDGVAQDNASGLDAAEPAGAMNYYYLASEGLLHYETTNAGACILKAITITDPFTVSFDANGGDDVTSLNGTPSVTLPLPTKGTESFLGWFDGETNVGMNGDKYTPTANITLVAHWEAVSTDARLSAITFSSAAGTLSPAFDPEVTNYTYTMPYGTAAVPTITGATKANPAAKDPVIDAQAAAWGETAHVHGVAASDDTKDYYVQMLRAPKDGVCIIKGNVGDNTFVIDEAASLFEGTADKNNVRTSSADYDGKTGWKFNSRPARLGLTLSGDETFQEGDVVEVFVTSVANISGANDKMRIFDANDATSTHVLIESPEDMVQGANRFVLPATTTKSLYLHRSNGGDYDNFNPFVAYFAVYRPMNPILTAIQFNDTKVDVTGTTIAATLPNGTDLGAMTITPTIVWNGAGTAVAANTWEWSVANTYTVTDKDGDATVYTITLTEAIPAVDPTLTYNEGAYMVGASALDLSTLIDEADSDGEITYTVKTDGGTSATITDGKFTATAAGTATITATQAATLAYNAKTVDFNVVVTVATEIDGIKLVEADALTGKFVTASTLSDGAYTIEGINYAKYIKFNSTFSGSYSSGARNNYLIYDLKKENTTFHVYAHNNTSTAYKIVAYAYDDVNAKVAEVEVAANENAIKSFSLNGITKNTRVFIGVENNNIYFCQVVAVESGADLMKAGEPGYFIDFGAKSRFTAASGTAIDLDGMEFVTSSGYTPNSSTEVGLGTIGTNYVKFKLDAPTTVEVKTNSTNQYYIGSTYDADEATSKTYGYKPTSNGETHSFDLTAGTWYLNPNTSNIKLTKLAFSAPKCAEPVIDAQPASKLDFAPGDMTASVTAHATDGGSLSYQWYNTSDDSEVTGADEATLTTTTEGTYYVIVTNTLADHSDNFVKSDNATLKYRKANDATLSSLTVSTGTLDPAFDAEVLEYNVILPEGTVDVPTLTATAAMAAYGATADVTNATAFVNYEATSTVLVTAEDHSTQQTYTVHFYVEHTILALVDVTGDMTWDFSKDGLADQATVGTEVIMANVAGVVNDANFKSDNIKVTANKQAGTKLQASMIMFHTTVDGLIKVVFSNTDNKSSERYLVVNGKKTDSGTKTKTNITYYGFVPAGDVVLTVIEGDGNMLNFASVQFTAKATPDYKRDASTGDSWMAPGELGTVCIPNGAVATGGDLYTLEGKNSDGKIVFATVPNNKMTPGVPYLFQATSNAMNFFYTDEATVAAPDNSGAMKSTFEDNVVLSGDDLNGVYYFNGHALWNAAALTELPVVQYRAYVKMDEVSEIGGGASGAPGRRYIFMDVHGQNATTDVDLLNAAESPVKMIIDGKMYILRGEKMYDATGRLVK